MLPDELLEHGAHGGALHDLVAPAPHSRFHCHLLYRLLGCLRLHIGYQLAVRSARCEPKTGWETYILGFSITSQLLVLALSVIDVDIATSAFLARRYSGSMRRMPLAESDAEAISHEPYDTI